MKQITWDEYYSSFYDWSLSTQKNYSYRLTDFGSADEVYEVVSEFAFYNPKFATRFAEKALMAGVRFTPDHVLEMALLIDKPVLSKMAEQTNIAFNREQLEEIHMLIDDTSFERISDKAKVDIFSDNEPDPAEEVCETDCDYGVPPPKKPGLFSTLFAVIAGVSLASGSKHHRHNGRCNGDCANCPPHYGYRYGRWYYGKGHVHGCEFGGNKGNGSL